MVATEDFVEKALERQNKRNFAVFVAKDDLRESETRIKDELHGAFNKNHACLEKIYAKLEKREQ